MTTQPVHRLHDLLEAASQRINRVARTAADRTVEGLGLAALASNDVFDRDAMLGAQFELNRKSAMFALAFSESLNDRLRHDCAAQKPGMPEPMTEPAEAVDSFARDVRRSCAPELRELESCIKDLLGPTVQRNPLRPETLSHALRKGVEAVSVCAELRHLLHSELGRVLALAMRDTYDDIIADMREAGVQAPVSGLHPSVGHGPLAEDVESQTEAPVSLRAMRASSSDTGLAQAQAIPRPDRLLQPVFDGGIHGWAVDSYNDMPSNLIRAHRDELKRAASGGLDHVVIDFIGSLFDPSLADPKMPPQVVRQIARLQLPMLRTALVDPGDFLSRMHALRDLISRVASLGAAFEDFEAFDDLIAQRFLAQVNSLTNDLIDGEFKGLDAYERKLGELEQFVSTHVPEQAGQQGQDPASARGETPAALGLQQRYAQALTAELHHPAEHDFLRTFLIEVWSRVLVESARTDGPEAERFLRLRSVAQDLCASVRPKANMQQREEFLTALPRLMQGLKEGMDLVLWPEPARKAFFGALLPAHAESLKVPEGVSGLDWNLLARQVESALHIPPTPLTPREGVTARQDATLPVLDDVVDDAVDDAVDWPQAAPSEHKLDIDLGAEQAAIPQSEPLPEATAPTAALLDAIERAPLADRVAAGGHYLMRVEGTWLKVKLTHVSPGRAFFVFTHGKRYEHTISLTQRMLARLCDADRFKDLEPAPNTRTATPESSARSAEQPMAEIAAA